MSFDVKTEPAKELKYPVLSHVWIYYLVGSLAIIMSLCLLGVCACLARRRRRLAQKDPLIPEKGTSGNTSPLKKPHAKLVKRPTEPWLTGVLAEQTIEFVVPASSSAMYDTTEDSLSEPDTLLRRSSEASEDRARKRSSINTFINPEDIEKGMYPEPDTNASKKRSLLSGLGKVGFSMHYNVLRQQLCVRLIGASQLPSPFVKDSANPFAKVTLLPDKTHKFMTKVHKNTVNPDFNEVFIFPIKREALEGKEIRISVYDQDKFNRKSMIGFICYAIKDAGINKDTFEDVNSGDIWTDLRLEMEEEKPVAGELLFSLCYNPEISSLKVTILKSRHAVSEENIQMVYIKVSLYVRKRLVRTRKTVSKKYQLPEVTFGDPFNIILPAGAIDDVDLVVTLCGKISGRGPGMSSSKRILGRTQVGSDCPKDHGMHHWHDMLASPKSTSAHWHPLAL